MAAQPEQDMQVRRAATGDVASINSLLGSQMEQFGHQYGSFRVDQLVETAFITLVAEVQGVVVAFASLTDVPNMDGLDASVAVGFYQDVLSVKGMAVSVCRWLKRCEA
jgi:hypothetical protein